VSAQREIAIGIGAYAAYLAVRALVWNDRGRARAARNAQRIATVERRFGVDLEERVQSLALRWPRFVDVVNAGYAAGNLGVSVGWLVYLYRRNDPHYRLERRAALIAFTAALPAFALLPTAPPRTLDEYVDTMATRGMGIDQPLLVRFYNPVAAFPSQHVAFAVVTGGALAARAKGPAGRAACGVLFPFAVALVVVATGNHFVADAAAGVVLGVLARALARGLPR
jgi:hypothetical protein